MSCTTISPVPHRILGNGGGEWIAEPDGDDAITLRRLEDEDGSNISA
jgi:hypothetical protein